MHGAVATILSYKFRAWDKALLDEDFDWHDIHKSLTQRRDICARCGRRNKNKRAEVAEWNLDFPKIRIQIIMYMDQGTVLLFAC